MSEIGRQDGWRYLDQEQLPGSISLGILAREEARLWGLAVRAFRTYFA